MSKTLDYDQVRKIKKLKICGKHSKILSLTIIVLLMMIYASLHTNVWALLSGADVNHKDSEVVNHEDDVMTQLAVADTKRSKMIIYIIIIITVIYCSYIILRFKVLYTQSTFCS